LADQDCSGTLAEKIYKHGEVLERHRHRYEFNMKYRSQMEEKGFLISGTSPDGALAELIELRDHPFFVAANITRNSRANRTNRIRSSAASFAPPSPTRVSANSGVHARRVRSPESSSHCA
jgi:CTP synthase (UTP-ammonia lyase)